MPFDDRAVRDTVARMEALLSEVRASRGATLALRPIRPPEIRVAIASAGHGQACDVCAEPLGPDHRHLLEPDAQRLHCACRDCARRYDGHCFDTDVCRLVPERLWHLEDLAFDDLEWSWLGIPMGAAFVTANSEGEAAAWYPTLRANERSRVDDGRWRRVVARHPALQTLEPDLEALLVYRRNAIRDHWIAPIDVCLHLAARVRAHSPTAAGSGREIESFFAALRRDALPARRTDLDTRP